MECKNNNPSGVNWIANIFGYTGKSFDGWVIDKNGYTYTLLSCMCNGNVPKILVKGETDDQSNG